tara:strand:+ start:946 stop:1347 length:402 start_codon:yes stop_codon:yes gene_type:complete
MFLLSVNNFIQNTENLKKKIMGGYKIHKELGFIISYLLFINTILYIFYNMYKGYSSNNEKIYFTLSLTLSIIYLHIDFNKYVDSHSNLLMLMSSINMFLLFSPYFINIIYFISRLKDTDRVFDSFINLTLKSI